MSRALAVPTGSPFARIVSLGSYRPSRVITNAEICETIDSTDAWIQERSGIVERRRAAPDETVADMGVAAGAKALAAAGLDPQSIDLVIAATATHPYQTPAAATEITDRLGATPAAALDISAACAGFCYGIAMASDAVRAGSATRVLVIAVEKLSDWVDKTDRGTAFLFADGAGAAVVEGSTTAGIGPVVWGSDGAQKDAITMSVSHIEHRDGLGEFPVLTMQGQAVFRWAIGDIAPVCRRAVQAAGLTLDDIDVFVPHQANMRITDALVRALKLPPTVRIARDIRTAGNTSAASVPLALDRMVELGEARSGDTALLVGFGAGLTYAAQVVTVP